MTQTNNNHNGSSLTQKSTRELVEQHFDGLVHQAATVMFAEGQFLFLPGEQVRSVPTEDEWADAGFQIEEVG